MDSFDNFTIETTVRVGICQSRNERRENDWLLFLK